MTRKPPPKKKGKKKVSATFELKEKTQPAKFSQGKRKRNPEG
jgi:hypothetical protein